MLITTHNNQDTNATTRSCSQLEIDNAYLRQQNEHLNKELAFARYTIQALKNMTQQRDSTLIEARQELENALSHIQMLSMTIHYNNNNSLSGIGPPLVDNDVSSDDQELSEEEEYGEATATITTSTGAGTGRKPNGVDIMSKLPLRQQTNNIILHQQEQLVVEY